MNPGKFHLNIWIKIDFLPSNINICFNEIQQENEINIGIPTNPMNTILITISKPKN